MRLMHARLAISLPILVCIGCLNGCRTQAPADAAVAFAASQPAASQTLLRIEYRCYGSLGSTQIIVTPAGRLTYIWAPNLQMQPEKTLRLTDVQIEELNNAARQSLESPSYPTHVSDYQMHREIGNQNFDEDGPNVRFDSLDRCLAKLCAPLSAKLHE